MKFVKYLLILAVCCILLGAGSIYGLYRYIEPQLPDVATLKDVRLQIPMQVYSADGELIAQYGEKRRIPVTLDQMPPVMVKAFIATEDSRFYEHHGVDPVGIFRAASVALFSGHASQGASTITQQLARNFFLSPERTLMRKIKEVFLAIRIEQLLSKDEILELYLNKIYLGYRAYGVGAAAQVYFGKTVDQLSLSEISVIAGLPKAPSTFNPLYSMDRATARRNVVLSRMLSENYITQAQLAKILGVPNTQVAMQEMSGYTLTLSRQCIVHPDYAKKGYTHYQFPSEGEDAAVLVVGLPLKSLLFDDTIPVDVHVEIPAHGVNAALSGTLKVGVNSLSAPVSVISDSDIDSIVQLRERLEQFADLINTALKRVQ